MRTLKFIVLSFLLLTFGEYTTAQTTKPVRAKTTADKEKKPQNIVLAAGNFEFSDNSVQFLQYKDRASMKLTKSEGTAVLKNFNFVSGTIEYDFEPLDPRFLSIYFRYQSKDESELFYFRTSRAGLVRSEDAIQYAPIVKGINLWDMMYHYQTHADFKKEQWNHVKLVVSGKQMRAYVNDMSKPALQVSRLEGDVANGTLAFSGQCIVSNLTVNPALPEDLPATAGVDETENDQRYLRKWEVNEPVETTDGIDFRYSYLPNKDTKWTAIESERRGLVNLTRKFGSGPRRLVWLRTTIQSKQADKKKLSFGFSDDVWVLLNGRLLYVDKNGFGQYTSKDPQGRCSVDNTIIDLPLNAGENSLMVGVACDFYGWGIVARLNNLEGIE